jgi:putative transposase
MISIVFSSLALHRDMSRIARVTVPGFPHHVTQRGNRRMAVFAEPSDYRLYLDLMAERCAAHDVACWA